MVPDPHHPLARLVARRDHLHELRAQVRALLPHWHLHSVLVALVLLEELARQACEASDEPREVQLSWPGEHRLRIAVLSPSVVDPGTHAEISAFLTPKLADAWGVEQRGGILTLWAETTLVPRVVPLLLPSGGVLAEASFHLTTSCEN
jgi:hypothetical protein